MKTLVLMLMLCFSYSVSAQKTETDSLKRKLAMNTNDTMRVYILEALSYAYLSSYPDTALQYALQGVSYARKIGFRKGEAICINAIGNVYFNTGDNAKALEMYLEYLKLKEQLKDLDNLSVAYFNISSVYTEDKDYRQALYYLFKARAEDEKIKDSAAILFDLYSLASNYARMGNNDSALFYMTECYALVKQLDDKNMIGAVLNLFGEIYLALNDVQRAGLYYNESLPFAETINDFEVITANYYGLAKIYMQKRMPDSAIYYGTKAFHIAQNAPFFKQALETSIFLSDVFKSQKAYDSAYHYQEISIAIKDSLFNEAQLRKLQDMKFEEQRRQQALETERIKYRSTMRLFLVVSISVILFVIMILLWRNNKHKQKANALLTEQKAKVEQALSELKSTQAQLIQSEKMASLGELTAGIAHEIQNPLNFVNNFSEVNRELIEELKAERIKANGERNEAAELELINDLDQNLERINQHGKRADAIVKGMLQHSTRTLGVKEPTGINAMCEEYLRLAYHGVRAKDKSFNATIKTDFDEGIDTVNIVPQDIGRVLLNLFNNAFYAVKERKNLADLQDQAGLQAYQPFVLVQTKKVHNEIEIKVADNGIGIAQNIIDKIFQPFFTTKPTGQGTGLGLSISYDIIKAHGGEIKVNTKEGEGTTFIVRLPASEMKEA